MMRATVRCLLALLLTPISGCAEIDRIKKGQISELTIPYEIEGTAWVSVESLGRLATGFGPAAGQWRLQR